MVDLKAFLMACFEGSSGWICWWKRRLCCRVGAFSLVDTLPLIIDAIAAVNTGKISYLRWPLASKRV